MLQKWAFDLVIGFVLRQLAKWADSIDWGTVKFDLGERVAALVPGAWFDEEAIAVANTIVDAAAAVLQSTDDIKRILELCAAEQWLDAAAELKDLILGSWNPTTEHEIKVLAFLKKGN